MADDYQYYCGATSDDAINDTEFPGLSPIRPMKPLDIDTESPDTSDLDDGKEEEETAMNTSCSSFMSDDSEYEAFKMDYEKERISWQLNGMVTVAIVLMLTIIITYIDFKSDYRLQRFMATSFIASTSAK